MDVIAVNGRDRRDVPQVRRGGAPDPHDSARSRCSRRILRSRCRERWPAFWLRTVPRCSRSGLLEPEYDLSLQIEVMGEMLKRHPQAGLIIAGSGSLEGELRAQIAAKAVSRIASCSMAICRTR